MRERRNNKLKRWWGALGNDAKLGITFFCVLALVLFLTCLLCASAVNAEECRYDGGPVVDWNHGLVGVYIVDREKGKACVYDRRSRSVTTFNSEGEVKIVFPFEGKEEGSETQRRRSDQGIKD